MLIEGHGVWAGLELYGLVPYEDLIADACGDHQIVGAGGDAGKGAATVGVCTYG